ncbi:hypothetical protein CBS101457_006530 [Exobasidium rhododendri]|nr:hypothetical protein CBS101457_006530 [Exobasidium rhododendri]
MTTMENRFEARERKLQEIRDRDKYTIEAVASHSREKILLCHEIILDQFGSVAARIASILLQRGRLTLRELSRFLSTATVHASTGLVLNQNETDIQDSEVNGGPSTSSASKAPFKSQRLIQQALLTLIQHNICWHVCVQSGGIIEQAGERGIEYFEINVDEVLPRVRFGAYLAIAEEEFGGLAFEVVNEVLKNGKLRARELIKTLNQGAEDREELISDLVRDLLYSSYLKPSLPKLHTSPRDRRISYEAESYNDRKKLLTPKQRVEIAIEAGKRIESDEKEVWIERIPGSTGIRRGLKVVPKKRTNGKESKNAVGSNKRGKLSNGKSKSRSGELAVSEDEDQEAIARASFCIDPDVFLRINFDRFDIHIRDEIIYKAARSRYNQTTAVVLQAMMKMNIRVSEEVPSIKDEQSAVLHINSIRQYLPDGISLKRAFERNSLKSEVGSDPAQSVLLGEVMAVLAGAGDTSRNGLARRLVSPGSKSKDVSTEFNKSVSQVHVQYGNAARLLRAELLHNVVEAQFGIKGTRVMSLLRAMGKLEEKHIAKITIMPMGETRDVCARLFASSLLCLQEVPKSSERIATRTIFFWYVDERKCTAWLCDHLFKTLNRLSQRRRQEIGREIDLVNKSQRKDYLEGSSLLSEVERRRLKRVRETIGMISLGEMRAWQDLFVVLSLPE